MLPTPINSQADQSNNSSDPANNSRQNRGTGFTNIGDILNANQGTGAKLGQAVGNNIAGQADSVKAGIQSSQDQFNTDKNQATSAANSNISAGNQYVRSAGESNDEYTSRLTGAGTDGGNPDFSKLGKNLQSAAYNGPRSLSNGDQLNAQAANVSALGRLAGTSDGQSQLLRSQVAQNGQYSTGQNSLDSLLLGTGGQQYLQPAVAQASQIGSQANNAMLNATAQANATSGAIDNNRTNVLRSLQASLNGTGTADPTANPDGITGLQTDAQNAAKKYTSEAQRIQELLRGTDTKGDVIGSARGNFTDSDRELLKNMSQYGINAGSIYSDPNNSAATNSALGNYANNLTTSGLGTNLYTDPQRAASINLAKLLNDQQSQTDIAGQKFQKDIQSDTQATQGQQGLDALQNGINGDLSGARDKSSGLQDLINKYGQGDTNLGNVVDNKSGLEDLMNRFQQYTGQNLYHISNASGDKKLGNILGRYLSPANDQLNSLQNNLKSNTSSVYDAALKRLLGQ